MPAAAPPTPPHNDDDDDDDEENDDDEDLHLEMDEPEPASKHKVNSWIKQPTVLHSECSNSGNVCPNLEFQEEMGVEYLAVLERLRQSHRQDHLKGSVSGSVQATDRLMKELRDIYRSDSFKKGELFGYDGYFLVSSL